MNHPTRKLAFVFTALLTCSLASTAWSHPDPKGGGALIATDHRPAPSRVRRPVVEVVFALDTTGSMSGLIEGAKQRIWGIANHIASGQPTPIVRIGLVGYRDFGDDYVVKRFDLSSDLDQVYEALMGFTANGGGDTPEHVNRALFEAISQTQWSANAMKMVFLVGDAPPHMDYQDGHDYRTIVREARQEGIVVHALRCGADQQTGAVWQAIASAGGGSFTSIQQDGGVVAIATPYDTRLAELSRELNDTVVIYGDQRAHSRMARKARAAEAAPAAAAADRGGYFSKTEAELDDADIVADVAAGKADVGRLDESRMSAEMKKMSVAQRKRHIEKQSARRKAIMKQMRTLTKKRDAYVKKQRAKQGKGGFDQVVQQAITRQAKNHKIKY